MNTLRQFALVSCLLGGLSGCGGGGDSAAPGGGGTTPPPPVTYTVGGTVAGLAGTGLVLRNNGGNDLTVTANGAFTFSQAVSSAGAYAVTVQTQPGNPEQVCSVTSGSGTASANVTNVTITCATTYQVTGTVSGLTGTGLVLRNNGVDQAVAANGSFTFTARVAAGSPYAVSVQTRPSNPVQACTVTNGSGTMPAANVTNVTVVCINAYSVGGAVTGLSGTGLVLRNNAGDDLPLSGNGPFTFTTPIGVGSNFAVTVGTQPAGPTQVCAVTSGTGVIGLANVTSVAVNCTTSSFTVGGTVIGLGSSNNLVLRNNAGNDLTVAANGSFVFTQPVLSGAAYAVTVQTQPNTPARSCTVSSGAGSVGAGNVTGVQVLCAGKYAYVSNFLGADAISKYLIGADGGLSTLGVNVTAPSTEPQSVAVTPSGSFVYVGRSGSVAAPVIAPDIAIYYNDPTHASEQLNFAGSLLLPTGSVPATLLMHPNGHFLYVAEVGNNDVIQVYNIDAGTGALTVQPTTYAVPTLEAVTLDSTGTYLYAASYGNDAITAYKINATTGALTVSPNAPRSTGTGNSEHAITVDPRGRFAFASHYREFRLMSYTIDATTGDLSAPITTVSTAGVSTLGSTPIVVEPQGRFVYAAIPDGTIQAYAVNQTTGALSAIANSPFTTLAAARAPVGPIAMTVDPSGQFLYMVNNSNGTIVQMRIDRTTGALTEVTPLFDSQPGPSAIAIN